MRSRKTPARWVPTLLAALLALTVGTTRSAAKPPPDAPGPPVFQLVDFNGDLIVTTPTGFLAAPVPLHRDHSFAAVGNVTGFAVSPAGETFIVGTDEHDSWLGKVSFSTGEEKTVARFPGYVIVDIAFDGAGRLFGLTDGCDGAWPHSLLLINPRPAYVLVKKALDDRRPSPCHTLFGAIAFNPADGSFYYSNLDANGHLFVDRLAPGSFAQTPVLTSSLNQGPPTGMAFVQGLLWLSTFNGLYVADITNFKGNFAYAGSPELGTPLTNWFTNITAILPSRLGCTPGPTVACLHNRFQVEVTYDARPGQGSGPAGAVLDSRLSAGFTFFGPADIEMMVKVVDSCATNGMWWLFAGGMTDAGVAIKVTDTATGAVKTYANARGHLFKTVVDKAAFSCP
jgi:hypothetical protein